MVVGVHLSGVQRDGVVFLSDLSHLALHRI